MPAMPRIKKSRGTKIAYKIMGVPNNMKNRKDTDNKVEKRLVFEETTLSRQDYYEKEMFL